LLRLLTINLKISEDLGVLLQDQREAVVDPEVRGGPIISENEAGNATVMKRPTEVEKVGSDAIAANPLKNHLLKGLVLFRLRPMKK